MTIANPIDNERARTDKDTTTTRSPATPSTPQNAEAERQYQRAYLIQQVLDAPGQQLAKGKANRFPRGVKRELNLTPTNANEIRDSLEEAGYLRSGKRGTSQVYEVTDSGRAYLATLPQKPIPEARKLAPEQPVSEGTQRHRRTFLLFQLFEAEGHTLEQKTANRFREPGRKFLDLKAPAANRIRKEMAEQGLLEIVRNGRNGFYRLTPAGRLALGACHDFPDVEVTIGGRVLNELLEAARDSARQFLAPPTEPRTRTEQYAEAEVGVS